MLGSVQVPRYPGGQQVLPSEKQAYSHIRCSVGRREGLSEKRGAGVLSRCHCHSPLKDVLPGRL